MLELERIPTIFAEWRNRYAERDERMARVDEIVRGDFSSFDPDGEEVESRSPNLVQVALEDTAEATSLLPTLRVQPDRDTQRAKREAQQMERIGTGYFSASQMDLLITETVLDMAAFGLAVWVEWPDTDQRIPLIEKRDPRTCYPEPGVRPGQRVRKCFFATEHYYSQLPEDWQAKISPVLEQRVTHPESVKVTIVEYFDEYETLVAGLYESSTYSFSQGRPGASYVPVELERWENPTGLCPVQIGSRFTLDKQFRGQFDQVLGPLEAHIRLLGMVLDYADQAVYSDVWVRDLIGEMPWGGGAYVELGPNGAIGRVPPAVTSLNVVENLSTLTDAIHLGGRWPKSRPGEVDQAIASAKFVEATTGLMNTAIRTYHQILKHMMEQALRVCFAMDKAYFPGEKRTAGILRNQEFIERYDASSDINLDHAVRIEYGLGLGRDPAQSAVLHIQYGQNEYISHETVQENIPGITDVARENARIDAKKFRDMLLARMLQGVETGEIPDDALVEIMKEREQGAPLADLYEKYIIQPRQERQSQLLNTGLGPPMMPGLDPAAAGGPIGPDGMPVPGPPGGGGGPMPAPPGAPDPAELLARVNIPAGPGGTLGAQVAMG